jgi:thiosulfate/3-mercaptopyruvate sulfurtransferase
MTDVLITAGELAEFLTKEPCVVIDTRNPEAYGAGHLADAVNVHEIFTYLATSTPEGIHELKRNSPMRSAPPDCPARKPPSSTNSR